MLTLIWLRGLLRRRAGRLAATSVGVAFAVGLLATLGSFLAASKAQMTQRARTSVGVDWQVEARGQTDPNALLDTLRALPTTKTAVPLAYGTTKGFEVTSGDTTQKTGAGEVLGYTPDYLTSFPDQIRPLAGAPAGVLVFQQTAANLHAVPGSTVTINRAGLPPATVAVDGVVDLTEIDAMFQKVGAPPLSQRTAPPDNVILVPSDQWHQLFDPLAADHPELVSHQIHIALSLPLKPDPSAAYAQAVAAAHNVELRLTGSALVGNNLAANLAKARSDALYAQVLFLFLGAPGAVLAALLTTVVAGAGRDRRRRDQALLRTRGATGRKLVLLGVGEAAIVGLVGSALGVASALAVGQIAFRTSNFGGATADLSWSVFAVLTGLLVAAVAIAYPAWRDSREDTVVAARRVVGRRGELRWQRWPIDLVLIAVGLLVFWMTSRNGYKLVLAVEGVTTISVNYWAFLAPACLWIGIGLLIRRLGSMFLRKGRQPISRLIAPISGPLSDTVAASMSRQRHLIAKGLTIVAMAGAFAASASVFNATYRQQAEVDAVLSNGADVTVVESPGASLMPGTVQKIAAIRKVHTVTPLMHRFAYVGNDLQDIYGVNASTIVDGGKLQDTYFAGGSARNLMGKLSARPDAALFSFETVKDFQLAPGDTVKLRMQDGATKQFAEVRFTYAGVVKKFPSAPSDSFVIGNADYIAKMTSSDHVGTYLVNTAGGSGTSTTVAQEVQATVGTDAIVKDIASRRRKIGSSLTSVEMSGLTKVELTYALALAAAASGLVLWLGLNERRRTFATAAALGARRRQLGGFVWSEALFVTVGGLGAGALAGWALTRVLVKILTGVFDPPPTTLAVPWPYLSLVAAVTATAVVIAALAAIRSTRRPAIAILRDI